MKMPSWNLNGLLSCVKHQEVWTLVRCVDGPDLDLQRLRHSSHDLAAGDMALVLLELVLGDGAHLFSESHAGPGQPGAAPSWDRHMGGKAPLFLDPGGEGDDRDYG